MSGSHAAARVYRLRKLSEVPIDFQRRGLVQVLLLWFDEHGRDLPWRRTRNAYAIWVSEIMLQQTQVQTVIGYWERWMREFPETKSLAKAPEERVLKLWEGLGYYSRARNLWRAAQQLVAVRGSLLPSTVEELMELPGIGRYTAGAIASIAYNQPAAILDGNVIRVLSRLMSMAGDPKGAENQKRLWAEARLWVEAATAEQLGVTQNRYGDINQSLMELGATLCTPTKPRCSDCPIASGCRAFHLGTPETFPQLAARPATQRRWFATALIRCQGRVLVSRRPQDVVNGGYWEFPNCELDSADADPAQAIGVFLGIDSARFQQCGEIRHSITRFRILQRLVGTEVASCGRLRQCLPGGKWVTLAELESLHLTGPHRKLARRLWRNG